MVKKLIFLFFIAYFGYVVGQEEPCTCCSENHRAFDFWVGTWSVTDPDGNVVGQNTIKKVEGGCAIREKWTSSNGNTTGTSINFYNRESAQWEQLWVDNTGGHLKLKGNRAGNQMVLSSEGKKNLEGRTVVNRITWTLNDDGTVRQLWEVMEDGKVTRTVFDGLYRQKDQSDRQH